MSSSRVQSVSDLAFNVSLVAYDFGYPGRIPNQSLALRKATKAKNIASLLATEATTTPKLEPSQAELDLSEENTIGLWVGMRPSAALEYPFVTCLAIQGYMWGSLGPCGCTPDPHYLSDFLWGMEELVCRLNLWST
jgi:hypothetical protein